MDGLHVVIFVAFVAAMWLIYKLFLAPKPVIYLWPVPTLAKNVLVADDVELSTAPAAESLTVPAVELEPVATEEPATALPKKVLFRTNGGNELVGEVVSRADGGWLLRRPKCKHPFFRSDADVRPRS